MNLDDWMDENPPERKSPGPGGSTFSKYKNEILILYEKGYTQKSILLYLREERGVMVKQSALSRWLKRQKITGKGKQ